MNKNDDIPTLFLTFLQPAPHSIICDDIYDSLISFGQINRIIKLAQSAPDKPQLLVEFVSPSSCNACINHLKHYPLPRLNITAMAEKSKMRRLTIKGESPYTRDYTQYPRPNMFSNFSSTRVLLVTDLPHRLTPETPFHLYNLFCLYGSISKVNVLQEKGIALIEFGMVDDAALTNRLCPECPFFESLIETTPSKHESIAAPVGENCRVFQPKKPSFEPKSPSVFVAFVGLHPIVTRSPNIPIALCSYFDHYCVPRPIDVFFESEYKGVFAFRDLRDAICCISVMNNLNENGYILELGFVDEPPMIPQENLQFLMNQINQMNPMNQMPPNVPPNMPQNMQQNMNQNMNIPPNHQPMNSMNQMNMNVPPNMPQNNSSPQINQQRMNAPPMNQMNQPPMNSMNNGNNLNTINNNQMNPNNSRSPMHMNTNMNNQINRQPMNQMSPMLPNPNMSSPQHPQRSPMNQYNQPNQMNNTYPPMMQNNQNQPNRQNYNYQNNQNNERRDEYRYGNY